MAGMTNSVPYPYSLDVHPCDRLGIGRALDQARIIVLAHEARLGRPVRPVLGANIVQTSPLRSVSAVPLPFAARCARQPPLTAPAVSPATIWRWANTVSSSTGKVTISAAAASGPQLSWSKEIML